MPEIPKRKVSHRLPGDHLNGVSYSRIETRLNLPAIYP
jgi:hypothetical protein